MVDQTSPFNGEKTPAAAKDAQYLGDIAAVDQLVRTFIDAASDAISAHDGERLMALVDAEALRFSGQMPGFDPIPGWASRNELGLYIAKHWNIEPDPSLLDLVRGLFLRICERIIAIAKQADSLPENDLRFRIDALIEEATATLTGTWEVVYPPEE